MHIDGLPLKTIDDPIDTHFHALLGRQILVCCIIFKPHDEVCRGQEHGKHPIATLVHQTSLSTPKTRCHMISQASESDPSVLRGSFQTQLTPVVCNCFLPSSLALTIFFLSRGTATAHRQGGNLDVDKYPK